MDKVKWDGKRPNCKNCIYCMKTKSICKIDNHNVTEDIERAFSCKYYKVKK